MYNNGKFKSWKRKHNKRYKKYFYIKKYIRKLLHWKGTKAIKDRILTHVKNLFEKNKKIEKERRKEKKHKKEEINCCKPVRVSNFWSNYIE